jgi:hypothetical protein
MKQFENTPKNGEHLPEGKQSVVMKSSELAVEHAPPCVQYVIDLLRLNCTVREESRVVDITSLKVSQDLSTIGRKTSVEETCRGFIVDSGVNATHSIRVSNFWETLELDLDLFGLDRLRSVGDGAQIGHIHLNLTVISSTKDCPSKCKQYDMHVAYQEPVSGRYVLLKWVLGSQHTVSIVISQIAHLFWLIYIKGSTHGDSCLRKSCILRFESRNSVSHGDVLNVVAASQQQGDSSFAEYHFIWGPTELSWTAADRLCRSAGMQLASIATEDEYNIVKGLLLGKGYRAGSKSNEDWITTPCRVESAVCLVFLGLRMPQVSVHVHILM